MEENNKFETEIDFKKLLKSPSRLFGWIFPYYLILFLVVGIFYVKNMDNSSFNNVPPDYTDSLDVVVSVTPQKGGIMPAVDLDIISNPTNEIVQTGKALYNTNCASCHGEDGLGNGVAAAALNPPPRNFHNLDGWTKGPGFENIYETLEKGISGTGMVAYEFLPVKDRIAIIHYVRTFTDYPEITQEVVVNLDNIYNLSEGVVAPNKVSLETAAEKISEEAVEYNNENEVILEKIFASTDETAKKLFKKHVENNNQVISIFKRDFESNNNADEFINRVINFPAENGFKDNVSLLSKDELISLFKLLSNSIS